MAQSEKLSPEASLRTLELFIPLLKDNEWYARNSAAEAIGAVLEKLSPEAAEEALKVMISISVNVDSTDELHDAIANFRINKNLLREEITYRKLVLKKALSELEGFSKLESFLNTAQLNNLVEYFSYFHHDQEVRGLVSFILEKGPGILLELDSIEFIARLAEYKEFDSILDEAFVILVESKYSVALIRDQFKNEAASNLVTGASSVIYEY